MSRRDARTLLLGRAREGESLRAQLRRVSRLDVDTVAADAKEGVARLEARVEELERRLAALESERA